MKHKKIVGMVVVVLVAFVLARVMIKPEHRSVQPSEQDSDGTLAETESPAASTRHDSVSGISDKQPPDRSSVEAESSLESIPDPQVQELQNLLDDDANREKTLTKAIALSYGTVPQQWAAINAFRWLGGREAVKALIRLRKEAYPELSDEAGRVLTHLLTEGLYSGGKTEREASGDDTAAPDQEPPTLVEEQDSPDLSNVTQFDEALWEQAIREAPATSDREELLILLSAFPGTKSVPVLLNLLESENPHIREHALEYLEFVTYGEKITNRQQGEDWLAKNGAMEQFIP